MKLLHLDSSALGANSISRELSAAVVAQQRLLHPDLQVSYRDLDQDPIPHLTGQSLAQADAAEAADAEQVMQQFLDADIVVIGAPMYNLSIPSTLKAWIDRIAVAGRTFRYTATGPEGLAGGKRVIIASARGGIYPETGTDFQEPYLRQVFGFLGIDEVSFVRAEGVAFSPQHRSDALAQALASLQQPEEVAA
ncbi:FMN-dependent NADH-azoreductase [Xanthomonas campestris pv. badrii]|uniref:FMN dependent NADH:quinone oxidoreductase n=1 Tax=Xanthomonas campestris pv. badrii TaxID=149696 RepID=A0A7Z2V9T8_XANCA|nr:FMN-dependent NADH-azoreductase [Xanthomonas campestris]MCC4604301.1 FMN-dependent NADH-azoreductase [Xanthomonas campestris pv. parthenii]QJD67432.1 FMN-dependent NADH-azoreductase [Xanthomonas campestris pv. badrii]